ncbi:MAG: CvpA family protein [Balneolaceae bacterium]
MNYLDILLLIPIGYFAYKGFMTGLIRELFGIIGVILAVFLTFELMDAMISILRYLWFKPGNYLPVLAGLIIFFGTIGFTHFLANLLHQMVEIVSLNFINQISGSVFGALKTGIVLSALLLLLSGFNFPDEEIRNESTVYYHIIFIAPAVYDIVATVYPGAEDFLTIIEKNIDQTSPLKNLPIFEN